MSSFQAIDIKEGFRILIIEERQELSKELSDRIEHLWNEECQKRGAPLKNNQILSLVRLESDALIGRFVPYKHYLAQLLDHKLKKKLFIRPVAISGVTSCGDQFLIGKRSKNVTQYPECYEFVPSGSIDLGADEHPLQVDLRRQFVREFEEETGMHSSYIDEIRLFAVVIDSENGMVEICSKIILDPVALNHNKFPVEEYQDFYWLNRGSLEEHIFQHKEEYVPLSIYLYRKW